MEEEGLNMQKKEIVIGQEQENQRIDKGISLEAEGISRSRLQKLLKEEMVLVNEKPVKPSYRLQAGDTVCVQIPQSRPVSIVPEKIPLDILYEDDFLLVVNKPQGMVVHPAPGHAEHTRCWRTAREIYRGLTENCGRESSTGSINILPALW